MRETDGNGADRNDASTITFQASRLHAARFALHSKFAELGNYAVTGFPSQLLDVLFDKKNLDEERLRWQRQLAF
jgi:hypothetical protein